MGSKVKGMIRPMFKLGKRLCFPSAPSWWVAFTVQFARSRQDCRPKTKILFPFMEGNDDDDDDGDCASRKRINEEEYYTPPIDVNWDPWISYKYAFLYCGDKNFRNQLSGFFDSQRQLGYTDTVTNNKVAQFNSSAIEIGKPFDVINFLSCCGIKVLVRNNGDRVEMESLRGKNIMVCCVFAPVFYKSMDARVLRALPFACSQAFSGDNYEVVMVPRMLQNWVDDHDAFDHFFSGFPSSWLAVPFSDTLPRDFVCKFLGLNNNKSPVVCLLVDHYQKVLMHMLTFPSGFDGFSFFTGENRKAHPQLDSILDCKPSDFVYKINSPDSDDKVPISEFKDKLVGLYLCKDGSFVRTLNLVYQECKARYLDFEIILVYLPYNDDVNPQLFLDAMNHLFHELNVSHWWVLPFDDFKSRWIWPNCTSFLEDELFIVGPHDEFVEYFGKHVIGTFGINAYPFTREHIVEKRYQELREVTLESLLIYGSQDYLLYYDPFFFTSRSEVPVEDLEGKTVLLYVDHAESLNRGLYFKLLYWYCCHRQHTGERFDFEVVFVDLDGGDASFDHILQMPWLSCPFDPHHSEFVMNKLWKGTFIKDPEPGVAAFGKHGQLLSIEAQDLLDLYVPDGIQSYDGLRNEVVQSVLGVLSENGVDTYKMT